MGLDMYAYVATREGQQREYYDGAEWDETTKDLVNTKVNKPREIAMAGWNGLQNKKS